MRLFYFSYYNKVLRTKLILRRSRCFTERKWQNGYQNNYGNFTQRTKSNARFGSHTEDRSRSNGPGSSASSSHIFLLDEIECSRGENFLSSVRFAGVERVEELLLNCYIRNHYRSLRSLQLRTVLLFRRTHTFNLIPGSTRVQIYVGTLILMDDWCRA